MLINQSEYVKTVGNISDLNKVYLGFYEGLQYSVLGPAHIPDDIDFQATSYGSHTECRLVTTQCGAKSPYEDFDPDLQPDAENFVCNNTMAGLNMTGNFAHLGQSIESYLGGDNNDSTTDEPIENVNTTAQSNFHFEFQYFYDSAKQKQVPQLKNSGFSIVESGPISIIFGLGAVENGPISNMTNQYFWAFAFSLDIFPSLNNKAQTNNPWAGLNLVVSTQGAPEGIMSCETNISEIVCLAHSPFTALFPCPHLNIAPLLIYLQCTLTTLSLPPDL